jgi:hypothetical protein
MGAVRQISSVILSFVVAPNSLLMQAFPPSQNKNSLLFLYRELRRNILKPQPDSTPNLLVRTQNLQNSLQISLLHA